MSKFKNKFNKEYQNEVGQEGPEFLHENSRELVEILQAHKLLWDGMHIFEIGSGPCRNLKYINDAQPGVKLSANDLYRDASFNTMHESVKTKINFHEADTLSLVKTVDPGPIDLLIASDHLMHIDPESVQEIVEVIDQKWRPKYILLREVKRAGHAPNREIPRMHHHFDFFNYRVVHHQDSRTLPEWYYIRLLQLRDVTYPMARRKIGDYDKYAERQAEKAKTKKYGTDIMAKRPERVQWFQDQFECLKSLLNKEWRAITLGARYGEEVQALRKVGVLKTWGFDLAPFMPYVQCGDMNKIVVDWAKNYLDFVYTNSLDHCWSLYEFMEGIVRIVKPGGHVMYHFGYGFREYEWYDIQDVGWVKTVMRELGCVPVLEEEIPQAYGLNYKLLYRKAAI